MRTTWLRCAVLSMFLTLVVASVASAHVRVVPEEDPAVYEVTVVERTPLDVLSVQATARDAPQDEAAVFLSYVARLSLKETSSLDAEAWVGRNIESGGQYFADGVEVRLYGTEFARTLEIVATPRLRIEVP